MAASPDITDAEYLQRQVDGLRWLLTKHLGNKTAYSASDFKTLPEDASNVETYGNGTTRAALLHFKGNDLHEEYYCIIAEPK
ncbi:MAG: hypothetical protein Q4D41_11010 [Prevotellaceae bacterium]|nr:hypothetical protein [Prevotellaceae bacterium]